MSGLYVAHGDSMSIDIYANGASSGGEPVSGFCVQ
jgi:hypothetical protein